LKHTIPEHFTAIVSRYGDHPAVMSRAPASTTLLPTTPETTILTYEELDLLSNALAHSLRSLGVKKGDRVAISLGNVTQNAALVQAVCKLGAILVPLNPSFNSAQLAAALRHLAVEVLVIAAVTDLAYKPCKGRSNLALLRSLVPDLEKGDGRVEAPEVPSLRTVVVLDNSAQHPEVAFPLAKFRALTNFDLLLHSGSGAIRPDQPLSPDEIINIQFTSGTTSLPKAAMLSHTSVLNNGALIADRMGLEATDRIVVPPPLFHCFGLVLGYLATVSRGAAILFPSPAFDPAASLLMAAEQQATGLYGVGTMFVAEFELLANPDFAARIKEAGGLDRERLRKGIAAGSSVPESLMKRIFETLGLGDLVICYGMTETSPVSVMSAPDDSFDKRTTTVGTVMPHTAVKIVDPGDRNQVVPLGERGELATSGYLVMQGYWDDPVRTALDRIRDEEGRWWMYSGDEARFDEDGYVEITGRIKDLIIRGGENIHPLEVENCLLTCPGVADASVVGVPDEKLGETVGAFVVVAGAWMGEGAAGDEAKKVLEKQVVRDWVKERLSGHLAPRYVWWIDEYPKTASGKVQKYKLREMAVDLIKLEQ
jgi:acyl-CoA synthetase (AMP-forming)/AMP-acid ligase II